MTSGSAQPFGSARPSVGAWEPANQAEQGMFQARRGNDPVAYAATLASVVLYVPFLAPRGGVPRTVMVERDGRSNLVVFTSPAAAKAAFGAIGDRKRPWRFTQMTLVDLLNAWARPGTGLCVDPGTPIDAAASPQALRSWLRRAGIATREVHPLRSDPVGDPQPVAVFSQTPRQAGRGIFFLLASPALLLLASAGWSKLGAAAWFTLALGAICLMLGVASVRALTRESRYAKQLRNLRSPQ